jgi:hypothetical protein
VFQREAGLAGFNRLRSAVSREVLTFADAQEFFSSPLIRLPFLDQWLEIVRMRRAGPLSNLSLLPLIDRERQGRDFEVSIKPPCLLHEDPDRCTYWRDSRCEEPVQSMLILMRFAVSSPEGTG